MVDRLARFGVLVDKLEGKPSPRLLLRQEMSALISSHYMDMIESLELDEPVIEIEDLIDEFYGMITGDSKYKESK